MGQTASPGDVTRLLDQAREGDSRALDRLLPLIYDELRRVARSLMRGERPDHTLQATAVVHEAYLRLQGVERVVWKSRGHFVAVAARLMRRVLVDHARRRLAGKRGGDLRHATFDDEATPLFEGSPEELLTLEAALVRLGELDPRQAKVVELRFFAGLSVAEAAAVLQVSEKTVKRDWAVARAWLAAEVRSR